GRAAASCPAFAASQPHAFPSGGPQACTAFRVENVGDDFPIAHSPCRPPCGSVKKTASVLGAVCAKPVDFQRQAVVQIAAYRPSHNGDAYQPPVCHAADGKFMPDNRLMVPVAAGDKGIGLGEWNRG